MIYTFARMIVRIILKCLAGWKVQGLENIPDKGPVILAANHVSYWDPIVVGAVSPRVVYFMAKKELFSILIVGWLLKKLNAFPVDREKSDRAAIRAAIQKLKENKVVGLFPEGTRIKDKDLGEFKHGVALIALKTGAPIVPIALKNTENIFSKGWFRNFQVYIGKPLHLKSYSNKKYTSGDIEKITGEIKNKIQEMLASDK